MYITDDFGFHSKEKNVATFCFASRRQVWILQGAINTNWQASNRNPINCGF
jgi:hypothetical protein